MKLFQELDEKKPWIQKENDISSVVLLLILLLVILLFFFNFYDFFSYFWLFLTILFALRGIFEFWIFYRNRWRKFIQAGVISGLASFFYFLLHLQYWGYIILVPEEILLIFTSNFTSTEETLPFSISSFFYFLIAMMSMAYLFSLGRNLRGKNIHSPITRNLYLSFLSLGLGWIFYFVYHSFTIFIPFNFIRTIPFLGYYCSIFFGLLLLAHACQVLFSPNRSYLSRIPYYLMCIPFIVTILLILFQVNHSSWAEFISYKEGETWGVTITIIYGFTREHTLLLAIIYSVSLLLPLGYSLYNLRTYPDWITPDRRIWIKRLRIGILLIIPYPLGEAVAGLHTNLFLQAPISPSNPLPQFYAILIVSVLFLSFASIVIYSGAPSVNKWFFDEIKIRATPELQKLNPEVKLSEIWKTVDQWQKESELTTKEMTREKLEEYIIAAKNLLLKEESKPTYI